MKRIFWIPLLLTVLLIVGTALIGTGTGLRLVARIVTPFVPGQLSYATLDGQLTGPIRFSGLDWQYDGLRLRIDSLAFEWQLSKLPSRHIHLDRLQAQGVHWQAAAADDTKQPLNTGVFVLPSLPVDVTVDSLTVDDILIDQGTQSLPIDRVQLSGVVNATQYRIDTFTLAAPAFDMTATAAIEVAAPHAIDATLSGVLRANGIETPINGTLQAQGNLDALDIILTADGAIAATLSAQATGLETAPKLAGELSIERFNPAVFGVEADTGVISGQLDLLVTAQNFSVSGSLFAPALLPGAAKVSADASLIDELLQLQRFDITLLQSSASLSATGQLRTDLSMLDLDLAWKTLAWPLSGPPDFASPRGEAKLTGSIDAYNLTASGVTADGAVPAMRFSLTGKGTATHFDIAQFDAFFQIASAVSGGLATPADQTGSTQHGGTLSASGALDWQQTPSAQLTVTAHSLDLSRWHEQLVGRAGGQATLTARLPDDGPHVALTLIALNGDLRGYTLAGTGRIDYAPGAIRFDNLDLRAGDALIQANGQIGRELDLRWKADVPDVGLFMPGASGLIRSQGAVSGRRELPALQGDLTLQNLVIGQYSATRLAGEYKVSLAADTEMQLDLDGTGLRIGDRDLGTLTANGRGTISTHTITLQIDGPLMMLGSTLQGGLSDTVWRGQLQQLDIRRAEVGTWQLAAPSALTLQRDSVALGSACLQQDDAQLCTEGNYAQAAPWSGNFSLNAFPLAALAGILPPGLSYEGIVSGQGRLASSTTPQDWVGDAIFQLSEGRVYTREDGEEDVLIGYENGLLEAQLDPVAMAIKIALDLRDAGRVDVQARVPLNPDQPLSGKVQTRIENLSLVPALLPQVGRVSGHLQADLVLAGTRAAPDLSGKIAFAASELLLPDLGITLTDAMIEVITQGNDLNFTGNAASGEGKLALDGKLRWLQGQPRGQLSLTGERFRAIDLPEVWLDASPAMEVSVDGREIAVSGDITVPAASITPLDLGAGIGVSEDQVIVGRDVAAAPEARWQIAANIRVTSGDDVHIKGYGLEGDLSGSVQVIEKPNQPTIGRGALEIANGRYRAYGQSLTIETGRLEFTGGALDDPGLNLRAARTAGDVTAGVQVRGALRRPVLSLYAIPAMSDTEAMSYLITGRGLNDLNEADQTLVTDAATRLALRGGSLLATSLGRELGLDSVGFEDSGETASTSLVIGKHLSPRLFVSYGIGLFEAINTIRLRYQINERLTLETESGTRTSADLLYSFDR